MKNNLAVHMRYHLFLHYGWFLQNLGKDFIPSNMHTTVVTKNGEIVRLAKSLCKMYVHGIPNPEEKAHSLQKSHQDKP